MTRDEWLAAWRHLRFVYWVALAVEGMVAGIGLAYRIVPLAVIGLGMGLLLVSLRFVLVKAGRWR